MSASQFARVFIDRHGSHRSTGRNGKRYRFDVGDRLREVVGLERYRYNGYGRRVTAVDDQGQRLRAFYWRNG